MFLVYNFYFTVSAATKQLPERQHFVSSLATKMFIRLANGRKTAETVSSRLLSCYKNVVDTHNGICFKVFFKWFGTFIKCKQCKQGPVYSFSQILRWLHFQKLPVGAAAPNPKTTSVMLAPPLVWVLCQKTNLPVFPL